MMFSSSSSSRGGFTPDNRKRKANENVDLGEIGTRFHGYSLIIDKNNDKRERIVKLSRDITISSKRLISLLQRFEVNTKEEILTKAQDDMKYIFRVISNLSKEMECEEYYRFQRAFSPGSQELVEALTFYHFLCFGTLLSPELLMNMIKTTIGSELGSFYICLEDYLLGVCDLTGELMRLCINNAAQGNNEVCYSILDFVKGIYVGFQSIQHKRGIYEIEKKLSVMEQSLKKVESACCEIMLRGTEYQYPADILQGLNEKPSEMEG